MVRGARNRIINKHKHILMVHVVSEQLNNMSHDGEWLEEKEKRGSGLDWSRRKVATYLGRVWDCRMKWQLCPQSTGAVLHVLICIGGRDP